MSSISSVTTTVPMPPVPSQTALLDKAQANKTAQSQPAPPPAAPQPSKPTETIGNNLNVVA